MDEIKPRDFAEPDRAAVQVEAIAQVRANAVSLLRAYEQLPGTFGGRYICSDSFKELFSAYRASPQARDRYNAAVHNSAAVLAALQFERRVRSEPEAGRDTVVFVTGVPGSGKSSSVAASRFPADCRVMFEGQLSRPETSFPKIDLALQSGLNVDIVAVHVAPELALERTLGRHASMGRGASIATMAEIQGGLGEGLRRLHGRYGHALSLTIIENTPGQQRRLDGWEHIHYLEKEGNREAITARLRVALEKGRAEGRVSEDGYRQAADLSSPAIDRHIPMGDGRARSVSIDGSRRDGEGAGGQAAGLRRVARALAFERLPEQEALRRHPELKGAYEVLHQQVDAIKKQRLNPLQATAELEGARLAIQRRLDEGRIPAPPMKVLQVRRDRGLER